jgi:hypothetical protein
MAELRQEYLRIVSPANDALDTFQEKGRLVHRRNDG